MGITDISVGEWTAPGLTQEQLALVWSHVTNATKTVADVTAAATAQSVTAQTVGALTVYALGDALIIMFHDRLARRDAVSFNSAPVGPPAERTTQR